MKTEWQVVVRTGLQVIVTLLLAAPVLVPALGLSTATGIGAAMLAAAAILTRVMQIPAVATLLNKYLKVPMPK